MVLKDKRIVVTGGAGFIGSHLVDVLIGDNNVLIIDDLSSGRDKFLNSNAEIIKGSLLDSDLVNIFDNANMVFHLAANPEVRDFNPKSHLNQNFLSTYPDCKSGYSSLIFSP